ncbi:hypothetical protein [Alteromonas sp. RKMC-009]|uniref:hypothetical protein n=1 Tax=Alteromonas sp. RKMC-009 TaxID=2267264 RepID=UPI000E688371|nr:hypothetical protein [Alteromonas sp. RKMC-009]AYA62994.1 hypothetical protein DS731_02655 [Alteromonas sp. RKMC-009]
MQFLVSLKNSESWQQIINRCQLASLKKFDDINELHTESTDSKAYCIYSALTLADISQLLANKEIQLVLSLDSPEILVSNLLREGKSLSHSVSIWNQQTVEILKLQQQHRRQLHLAQADGLLICPAQIPEWLASKFSAIGEAPSRLSHDFYSLMASQALRQNHETETTWQRLIACSLPLLDDPYLSFDLDAIYQVAIVQKEEQLADSKGENELLLHQLFHVQEELEKAFSAEKQQQIKLEKTSQLNKNTEQQLAVSKDENEVLLQQLFSVQEELDYKLKKAAAEVVKSKHQLAAVQAELKAISASKLWKSVAPVRKLTKVLSAKRRNREQLRQDAALILASEYFDVSWYLQNYQDVAESGMPPAEHYLCFGGAEGRAPGPLFDSNWYLSRYPDVAKNGINPLLHYVKFGVQEGRTPSPKLQQHQKGTNL